MTEDPYSDLMARISGITNVFIQSKPKKSCRVCDILTLSATFWVGVRYGTHDLLYLVHGRSSRKQSFSKQHFSKDAAEAPHIHTIGVPLDKIIA